MLSFHKIESSRLKILDRVGTKPEDLSLKKVMMKYTAVLEKPVVLSTRKSPEPLLRQALGAALRGFRADRGITLRELAEASRVSPGYLSELERGRKEVSSELLASVCQALGISVSDVLIEAAGTMAINHADVSFARV